MTDETDWTYVGHSSGDRFLIGGINVWEHEWARVEGATANVRDPAYHSPFEFPVYEMASEGIRVVFASGEFSNGVFGFYIPKALDGRHH